MNVSSRVTSAVAAAVALFAGTAVQADVTMEQKMSVQGAGMMRMANMTGTSVTTISGNRSRTQSELRFESALMRTVARGASGETVEIVDLGADRIYDVNPKKKTYTQTTFGDKQEKLQKQLQAMQQSQAQQSQSTSGVDQSQCEWLPAKSQVKRTGEKSSVAGFAAEHVVISASQPCRDRKTGQVCEFGLTLDQWVAPDFKESAETLRYQQAYAEKLGLAAAGSRDFAERAQAMFGSYEGLWGQVAAKLKDVKGYPVKAGFGLGIGGAQCQGAQQAQANAAAPSPGGAILQGLGGMFGKKKNAEPQPAAPPVDSNGLVNLMTVSTELLAVTNDAAPADSFEVPAGYKLVND